MRTSVVSTQVTSSVSSAICIYLSIQLLLWLFTALLRHCTGSNEFSQEIPLQKKQDYLQVRDEGQIYKGTECTAEGQSESLKQPLKVYETTIRPEVCQNHRLAVTPPMFVLPSPKVKRNSNMAICLSSLRKYYSL